MDIFFCQTFLSNYWLSILKLGTELDSNGLFCVTKTSRHILLSVPLFIHFSFSPMVSYHLSLRLFCLFLSDCFTHVLLYTKTLIRLCRCTDWFESLLYVHANFYLMLGTNSFYYISINAFCLGNPKWVFLQTVKTQMKCSIMMLHFTRVYTVREG